MLFTSLPGSDLRPSVLCLGTGSFGSTISTDDSFALLDAFAEAGGNFADSAHIYAAWLPNGVGQSERTLGAWVRSRNPQGFIVGTKGGHPHLDSMEISRLSPDCIARDVDESLERLGLDFIDLYWLHRDAPAIPVDEIMDALDGHVQRGRIGALGASNWTPERITAANELAAERGMTGFCASQIGWSPAEIREEARGANLTLQMDDATHAWHRASGFPVIAYSAQAGGYFAHGLPLPGAEPTEKQKALAAGYGSVKNEGRYRRAAEIGSRLGRTANEVALAYLWSQEFPSVAIVGCRTVEQLKGSMKAGDLRLESDDVKYLEESEK